MQDIGYLDAQSLRATYQANLGEVQIRQQSEANSFLALQQAQRQIEQLLASASTDDRDWLNSQLLSIINQLKQVQPGTTAYREAEELLNFAQNKRSELQKKK